MIAARSCFWRDGGGDDPPALERARDVAVEQRRGHLDRVARQHARVEAPEPAAVLDHHVVPHAVAPGLPEGGVGDLVHADRARRGPVHVERVPRHPPAPVGAGHRVARALHLGQRGEQLGRDRRRSSGAGRAARTAATSRGAPWRACRSPGRTARSACGSRDRSSSPPTTAPPARSARPRGAPRAARPSIRRQSRRARGERSQRIARRARPARVRRGTARAIRVAMGILQLYAAGPSQWNRAT